MLTLGGTYTTSEGGSFAITDNRTIFINYLAPEPGTTVLLGLGLMTLSAAGRHA